MNCSRLQAIYCYSLKAYGAVLHLRLRSKHSFDKLEGVLWLEALNLILILVHLDQFQVEHVVDEAEQEIELGHDQIEHLYGRFIQVWQSK